jgi:hypothetical protein
MAPSDINGISHSACGAALQTHDFRDDGELSTSYLRQDQVTPWQAGVEEDNVGLPLGKNHRPPRNPVDQTPDWRQGTGYLRLRLHFKGFSIG